MLWILKLDNMVDTGGIAGLSVTEERFLDSGIFV